MTKIKMKHLKQYIIESSQEINAFVILKPEFLKHEDDWYKMLENNGWQIVQKKKVKLTEKQAKELYKPLSKEDFYDKMCKWMASDDCICATCHKDCKDPIAEMRKLKHKVRDAWAKDEMKNAMHSSDSMENVKRESDICINNIIK